MTVTSNQVPDLNFRDVAQPQQQQQQQAQHPKVPGGRAVQGNETFVPIGTPASDLDRLFPR